MTVPSCTGGQSACLLRLLVAAVCWIALLPPFSTRASIQSLRHHCATLLDSADSPQLTRQSVRAAASPHEPATQLQQQQSHPQPRTSRAPMHSSPQRSQQVASALSSSGASSSSAGSAYPSHAAYADPMRSGAASMSGHMAASAGAAASAADSAASAAPASDPSDPTISTALEFLSSYSVPNSLATASASPLPIGVLISPSAFLDTPVTRVAAPPQRCLHCTARLNLYARLSDAGQSRSCPLCSCTQPLLSAYAGPNGVSLASALSPPSSAAQPPELSTKVVEFVSPRIAGGMVLPATVFPASHLRDPTIHPLSSGAGLNFVFVVDGSTPRESMGPLRLALSAFIRSLPPEAGLAVVSFTHVVSLYDLAAPRGTAAASIFPGHVVAQLEDVESFLEAQGVFFPRVEHAADAFCDALESLEQKSLPLSVGAPSPRALGAAVDWVLALVQAGRSLEGMEAERRSVAEAAASEAASASASASSSARKSASPSPPPAPLSSFAHTHCIVLSSGAPDFGPGACASDEEGDEDDGEPKAFYSDQGRRARSLGVRVDYFCAALPPASAPAAASAAATATPTSFAVSTVRGLVESSGGTVSLAGWGSPRFEADLRSSFFGSAGFDGVLDVYFSSGLRLARVVGPVASLEEVAPEEERPDDPQAFRFRRPDGVAHMRLSLTSCRPDESVALYFALRDDLPQDYVYLQFACAYTDWNHQRVVRVSTRRVRTTGNRDTFVRSIDVKVVALLIAKRCVLRAAQGEKPEDSRKEIANQVRDACVHFGQESRTSSGGVVFNLPSELSILPLLLFHLRRGPLISGATQSSDEIDVARYTFLHASRSDAVRMVMPSLLSFLSTGALEELPLETLALQSNRILLLDHHTQIGVWSGADVSGPAFDAYRRAMLERAAGQSRFRTPRPEILSFTEGSSDAGWMQARLIPTHKDSEENQLQSFPQLQALSPAQRHALASKFGPTDEATFWQFFLALFNRR